MTIGDTFGPGERRPLLRGASGWLLFLCITLIVLVPIRTALFVWVFVRTPDIAATFPVLIGIIALDGFGTVSGVLLYRERPLGVLLAKIYFGLRIAFGIPVVLQSLLLGLGACLSSHWSRGVESDSLRSYEQGFSRLEDR